MIALTAFRPQHPDPNPARPTAHNDSLRVKGGGGGGKGCSDSYDDNIASF